MKRKIKKCSDQRKAGELNFSFQILVTIPPDFLIFVSRTMVFLGIIHRIFRLGAKRSQNSTKLEAEKSRKVDQLLNFWSFFLNLSVVVHNTPSLVLFIDAC